MKNQDLIVKRKKIKIMRDTSRVITRPNIPGNKLHVRGIIDRILNLSVKESKALMQEIRLKFAERHKNITQIFERHYKIITEQVSINKKLNSLQKLLIGAHFTMEYAIESAALFNPSIILDPDQTNTPAGGVRFIMSLRATGEGHISSIVFRSGIIDKNNSIIIQSASEFTETPDIQVNRIFNRHLFQLKIHEMKAANQISENILSRLSENFTHDELSEVIKILVENKEFTDPSETINIIYWLAHSNYEITFDPNQRVSERVIFPVSENEAKGIEDARFVQFIDDDGTATYYATYTAYNGVTILPQLIKTKDFITFNVSTLNGKAVQNKGMALFPRKINGKYAMLSRQDGENNHIMFSENLYFWQKTQIIQTPQSPWEFIQIGNCGSPIETKNGWLVLTHGVGAMRQYCIGAILLDLENPEKVIAHLKNPLITPNDEEREGYVPNVVYSCGALIHNDELIIPYAMSDISTGIAVVNMSALMDRMLHRKP